MSVYPFLVLLAVSLCIPLGIVRATTVNHSTAVFESVISVAPQVTVPTVVEMPVSNTAFQLGDFVILEDQTGIFQSGLYREYVSGEKRQFEVTTDHVLDGAALVDNSLETWVEFPVASDGAENRVTLHVSIDDHSFVTTGFSLKLEPYVAQPRFVEVSVPGKKDIPPRIILAKNLFDSNTVHFPKISSNQLDITFWYTQPLRISELSFFDHGTVQRSGALRFLAQPDKTYSIFFASDGPVVIERTESANLFDNRDVVRLSTVSPVNNPAFVLSDRDGDGISDRVDNCTAESNTDQQDENENGRGDVCDDYDKDGVINIKDNCPPHPNRNQQDTDGDGIGDICDGEESRILERNAWLLWVIITVGGLIIAGLFVTTVLQYKKR